MMYLHVASIKLIVPIENLLRSTLTYRGSWCHQSFCRGGLGWLGQGAEDAGIKSVVVFMVGGWDFPYIYMAYVGILHRGYVGRGIKLGGGFNYFCMFTQKNGEMIRFDDMIFLRWEIQPPNSFFLWWKIHGKASKQTKIATFFLVHLNLYPNFDFVTGTPNLKGPVVNRKGCFVGFKKVGLVYQIMGSTCMKHLFNILQLGDELKGSIFRRSKMLTSIFMIIHLFESIVKTWKLIR